MDGDNHRMKQHGRVMASSGMGHAAPRQTGRGEPFQDMHPRGDQDSAGLSAPPERAQISYADYVYPGNAFHGGSLQANEVPEYQQHDFSRASQRQPHSQPTPVVQQQRRRPQAQELQQQFAPYESATMYGFAQQGLAQGAYEVVPQYSARQSAAMDALSNQVPVPRYFAPEEPWGTGVVLSPYMNAQLQPAYNQSGPMARATPSEPFPATMAEFAGSTGRLEPQQQQQQEQQQPQQQHGAPSEPTNLDQAYSEYQSALRSTFGHTRAGRLVEASESLLEISEWLVTHARDLGILRDDHLLCTDRLNLWNDFNLCWLALYQKQKDLTQDLVLTGYRPAHSSLLSRERLEIMGNDLIQLCDQLEQHGLVDYQMGIWEEEILCILSQCLDLIESRPDLLHIHTVPEPATAAAAPRP